ncbi:MAG: exosortase-associated EpsI family protein [Planctomycetes bacterium]|nr:exosortase-associated EpsI family protein [Planctomycetota bacterium]
MQRTLIIASAVVVLIASGVVHGVWTDRWSEPTDLGDAATRLGKLPMVIGDWHGTDLPMEPDSSNGLAGMIARRYVHATNGKSVTILLACGRARAVCTHTPEVCYAGNGYEVETPRRFALPSKTAQAPPEFWTARFVKERAEGKTHLRIYWSWHGTEGWRIAEHPRVAFAGEKMLHKLYLMRDLMLPDEPIDGDPCVEFMQDLLPVLRREVF